jgi:hypothetical protein
MVISILVTAISQSVSEKPAKNEEILVSDMAFL